MRSLALHQEPHHAPEVAAAHEFLDEDHRVPVVEPAPAPLRVEANAQQPDLPRLAEEFVGEVALGLPLFRVGKDLSLREAAHALAEGLVLLGPVRECHDRVSSYDARPRGGPVSAASDVALRFRVRTRRPSPP
jgi:hypothetical protein